MNEMSKEDQVALNVGCGALGCLTAGFFFLLWLSEHVLRISYLFGFRR